MECSAKINDSFTIYVHDLFDITYTSAFTVDNLANFTDWLVRILSSI